MSDPLRHVVDETEVGTRFDRLVATVAGLSRAEAAAQVDGGRALLDDRRVQRSTRVFQGQIVAVLTNDDDVDLPAARVPYSLVYEDEALLVIDKPAGVVVHPGAAHPSDTLVNGLVGDFPELRELGKRRNWGLVHRLDRGTSGLLIVARDRSTQHSLQGALRAREIIRRYRALAARRTFDNATGTIEAPIGRDPHRPTRMAVIAGGRSARTHYERLAAWDDVTLFKVTLETGRTHQIRVHFAAIAAPLVGDPTYGDAPSMGLEAGRVWLHAGSLVFVHPRSEKEVSVESQLPVDLSNVLRRLGQPDIGTVPGDGANED
jgi:23S rRNA pseudouridine1911/1915/1917 synthase